MLEDLHVFLNGLSDLALVEKLLRRSERAWTYCRPSVMLCLPSEPPLRPNVSAVGNVLSFGPKSECREPRRPDWKRGHSQRRSCRRIAQVSRQMCRPKITLACDLRPVNETPEREFAVVIGCQSRHSPASQPLTNRKGEATVLVWRRRPNRLRCGPERRRIGVVAKDRVRAELLGDPAWHNPC